MGGMTDAEVLALLDGLAASQEVGRPIEISEAREAIAALIADRDALRVNDRRYQWLRENDWDWPIVELHYDDYETLSGADPDKAIDAAIKSQEAREANVRT